MPLILPHVVGSVATLDAGENPDVFPGASVAVAVMYSPVKASHSEYVKAPAPS